MHCNSMIYVDDIAKRDVPTALPNLNLELFFMTLMVRIASMCLSQFESC